METKEAIRILSGVSKYADKVYREALNMAISALKKLEAIKSCTPPSDDWEHYADRLHDIAYQSGYEQGKRDAEQDRWIPVTERLPEEDKDVLIAYRYKEGEGDTSHVHINITTYGDMYFGGNPVHNTQNGNRIKHWRQPFAYFASNYEVIAWRPLPEPYREDDA